MPRQRLRSSRAAHALSPAALIALLLGALGATVRGDSLWDGETKEFWDRCKACTSGHRVFCFTTGECLDLDIDAPSEVMWAACMNPLLIPDSCRTKGIHPPGTPPEVMAQWDRDL
mmetsp:Transcript_10319/g.29921  ORF Transcript_10319/g.29921 Transcript_10319/m.29921 type:complete len:115 (-) Transcript_10319:61-405(-)